VADAERSDIVVTRRSQPVPAVVSMRRIAELDELAEVLRDLALVLARSATDGGNPTSLDEVREHVKACAVRYERFCSGNCASSRSPDVVHAVSRTPACTCRRQLEVGVNIAQAAW